MVEKKEESNVTLGALRKEIVELRRESNKVNEEKEKNYQLKREIDEKLNKLFKEIGKLKRQRDHLNDEIKVQKKKREELEKKLKAKLDEVKKIRDDVEALKRKLNIEDPAVVERKIKKMEFYLETQPMDFKKEKQIRDNIKRMRDAINKVGKESDLWSKYMMLSHDVKLLKDGIKSINLTIREKAKAARNFHNQLLKVSDDIPKLKEERKNAWEKFLALKKKYLEMKDELKKKTSKKLEISKKSSDERKKEKEIKEEEMKINLKEKKKEIEEKIKTKKKLTTQDLLLFQKINESEDLEKENKESEKK